PARNRTPNEESEHYHQALHLKPDSAEAHNNLGLVLDNRGQHAEAIEHYRHALHIKPVAAEVHTNWGNVLAQEGKLAEAVEHYQRSLQIDPSSPLNALRGVGVGTEEAAPSRKGKRVQ